MKTTVYFSENEIQILGDELTTLPLPQGVLVNGLILNEQVLIDLLRQHKRLFAHTLLVLDSSRVIVKKLQFPDVPIKKLTRLIQTEFATSENADALLFAANIERVGKQNEVIACAAESSFIEPYVNIFAEAEIKLQGIDVAINSLVKYIEQRKELQERTFAVNLWQGNSLLSLLFENGRYIFSTRARLLEQAGSAEFAREVLGKLSALVQFNRSQRSAHEITDSYYYGLGEENLQLLQASSAAPAGIRLDEFVTEHPTVIYPYAGACRKKTDVNFLAAYRGAVKKPRKKISKKKVGILLLVLVWFGVGGYLLFDNISRAQAIKGLDAYLTDEVNVAAFTQAQQIDAQIAHNQATTRALQAAALVKPPLLTAEELRDIFAQFGMFVTPTTLEYSQSGKTLTIVGQAKTEEACAAFVKRLKSTEIFAGITYNGYQAGETSDTVVTRTYSFQLICNLKAGDSHE